MQIIIGHSNMDLDCLGSMVLMKYIYPRAKLIQSNKILPIAKSLINLYKYHLDMIKPVELKNKYIDHIVIVDTRTRSRVQEYLDYVEGFNEGKYKGFIEVWDHHPSDDFSIKVNKLYEKPCGANTTIVGSKILKKGIEISPDDATIALTAIFADTMKFTNHTVTELDFQVAGFLLNCGASLKVVKKILHKLSHDHQVAIFHEILNHLNIINIKSFTIITSYMELEYQVGGLSAIIDELNEVENCDAIFAVFYFKKRSNTLIVSRSNNTNINVELIMNYFGGGGHKMAASSYIKKSKGNNVFNRLIEILNNEISVEIYAEDFMSKDLVTIDQKKTLLDASFLLEKTDHTGAPVIDSKNKLVGIISLRDIMKGRKVNNMHAPISAYMTKKIKTISKKTTLNEIEKIILIDSVGHLPVVEDDKLIGIITRSDLRKYLSDT